MPKFRYIAAALAVMAASLGGVVSPTEAALPLPPIKVAVALPLPPPACADLTTLEVEYWSATAAPVSRRSITPLLTGFGCAGDVLTLIVDGARHSAPLNGSTRGITFTQNAAGPACVQAEVTRPVSILGLVQLTRVLDRMPDQGCLPVAPPPAPTGCQQVVDGTATSITVAAPACADVVYSSLFHPGTDFSAPITPVIAAGAASGVAGPTQVALPTDPIPPAVPNVFGLWRASRAQALGGGETARFAYSGLGLDVRPAPPACADLTAIEIDRFDTTQLNMLLASALLADNSCAGDVLTIATDTEVRNSTLDGTSVGIGQTYFLFNPMPTCITAAVTRAGQVIDRLPDRGCIPIPAPAVFAEPLPPPSCRDVDNGTASTVELLAPSCAEVTYSITTQLVQFTAPTAPIFTAGAVTGVSGALSIPIPVDPVPGGSPHVHVRWRASLAEYLGGGEFARLVVGSASRHLAGGPVGPPCPGCSVGGRFR